MRALILGLVALVILVPLGKTAHGQTEEEAQALRDNVLSMAKRIADQPSAVQDWLSHSHIVSGTQLHNSFAIDRSLDELTKSITKEQLENIATELYSKNNIDLTLIKIGVDDNSLCSVINCYGISPQRVRKIAEAVSSGKDKEESVRTANVNTGIAISGAVLAVLSLAMSAWSTVTSARSKKSTARKHKPVSLR
jgi:hypothetical protein